eukprot:4666489-Prorocentrum_lima.AAC.1
MSQVILYGLGSQVPQPIDTSLLDNNSCIILKVNAQELMDISSSVAKTLREHGLLTGAVMSGTIASRLPPPSSGTNPT